MPDIPIEFISEDIDFILPNQTEIKEWIDNIIKEHQYLLENLTYIFCSDEYILQINVEYLNHDTYTDIITFNNADDSGIIESDIFISIDRVKDNAANLSVNFIDELHRVLIHGVLHLLGYDDKTEVLKSAMRSKEDNCLSSLNI